eukprot:7079137-Heterocapsa_arctica.AAC.1
MVVLHETQQCKCLSSGHLQEHEVEQTALHHHLRAALDDGDLVVSARGQLQELAHAKQAHHRLKPESELRPCRIRAVELRRLGNVAQ